MKQTIFSIFLLASFFASPSFGYDLEFDEATNSFYTVTPAKPSVSKTNYLLGLRSVNFDYKEPDVMKTQGLLTGVAGSVFHSIQDGILLRFDGEYLQGTTNYDGALSNSYGERTPHKEQDKFRVMNFSGKGVFSTDLSESFVTAPYLGLGYRNTYDSKDNTYDYTRDITYYYLLYGLQFEFINNPKLVWLLDLEFDTLMGGQADTHLSDVNPRYPDLNLEFTSGSAFKIGAECYYTIEKIGKIMAELSFKKWQLAQSKPKQALGTYFVEPANETILTSLTLGYFF